MIVQVKYPQLVTKSNALVCPCATGGAYGGFGPFERGLGYKCKIATLSPLNVGGCLRHGYDRKSTRARREVTLSIPKTRFSTVMSATRALHRASRGSAVHDRIQANAERLLIDSGYLRALCNAVPVKLRASPYVLQAMGLRARTKPVPRYTGWPRDPCGCSWDISACGGRAISGASNWTRASGRPAPTPGSRPLPPTGRPDQRQLKSASDDN